MEHQITQVDQHTMLQRLLAWNERLDRQLDSAMRSAGGAQGLFEKLPERIARFDPRQVQAARQRLDRAVAQVPAHEPAHLQRPSVFQIASRFRGRLIRT